MREVEPSLMGKSDANECNESSLSNCRVQLALSTKKDEMILEGINSSAISLKQVDCHSYILFPSQNPR